MIGIQLQNPPESGFAPGHIVRRLPQGQTELIVRFGKLGADGGGLSQLCYGFHRFAFLDVVRGFLNEKHGAPDSGFLGVNSLDLDQFLTRLFLLPRFLQSLRQLDTRFRQIGIQARCPAELFDCPVQVIQFEKDGP